MDRKELLADIQQEYQKIDDVILIINKKKYTFYFKPMTIFEHMRIKGHSMDDVKIYEDGKHISTDHVFNPEMYAVNVVLEKALDEKGNRLFTLTDIEARTLLLEKFSYEKLSHLASVMSIDIAGIIEEYEKNVKNG